MSVVSGSRMRETIHSGHFMVSDFEPESEAQDEEFEVGMQLPPGPDDTVIVKGNARANVVGQGAAPAGAFGGPSEQLTPPGAGQTQDDMCMDLPSFGRNFMTQNFCENFMGMGRQTQFLQPHQSQQQQVQQQQQQMMQVQPLQNFQQQQLQLQQQRNSWISIDSSLTKLFQCMSLAYRQKLTSPKWNRFKGVRLRWKDKIRLNNVIWRCWHMQFIMKKKTMVCQFASPLDVDQHNKPEAVVMEGKYWKRKLSNVAAEYKKWRLFYRNRIMGWNHKDSTPDLHPVSLDGFDWNRPGTFGGGPANVMFDDDLLMDFTDILFSSLSNNQPFAFPNPREIARAGMVADFIQPGLIQLQPNLEDFMDTLEPLQDYVNSKILPPVPEELENFAPPDSLLPDVLPNMMQKDSNSGAAESKASVVTSSAVSSQQAQAAAAAGTSTVNSVINSIRGDGSVGAPFSNGSLQQDPSSNQGSFFPMSAAAAAMNERGAQGAGVAVTCANPVSTVIQQSAQQQQASSTSPAVAALLQQDSPARNQQNQGSPTGPAPRNSFTNRSDMFVKPVGKPRPGRSRNSPSSARSSGPMGQPSTSPGAAACTPAGAAASPQQTLAQQQQPPQILPHPQMPNAMVNSDTLLSHLLGTSPAAATSSAPAAAAGFSGSVLDKMSGVPGVGMPGSQNGGGMMGAAASGPINMMIGAAEMLPQSSQQMLGQRQQQAQSQNQPWNPKNANETLNPNLPINFSGLSKPILQMGQQSASSSTLVNHQAMSLAAAAAVPSTSGNISPPLLSNTPSPPMGPPMGSGPGSPVKPFRPKSDTERVQYKVMFQHNVEHRRVCHINAEQKRRCNIKNGFDTLHALIPQLNHNPNAKVSKAAMLQKGAEYIRQLKMERAQLKEEIETHRQEVEALNAAINNCQSMLPATGAPVSRQRTNKMTEMFDQWVRIRTTENWKFWIFSILIRPLLDSYNNTVSTASVDELCRTVLAWVDQHCSLVDLRPVVLNSLRYLCTTTDILTNPANLSEEAYRSISRPNNSRGDNQNTDRDPLS